MFMGFAWGHREASIQASKGSQNADASKARKQKAIGFAAACITTKLCISSFGGGGGGAWDWKPTNKASGPGENIVNTVAS